jgi:H+/gluconate symporter-like permease
VTHIGLPGSVALLVWLALRGGQHRVLRPVLLPARGRNQRPADRGDGAQDDVVPLINTAAVIGFGGVATHTRGFEQFLALVRESGLPPLVSSFVSVSLVSAITGATIGGLQIFMQTLVPGYLAAGIEPEVLHRGSTMAAGGFDSLPHCSAIVAMLTITGLTHNEAYKFAGIITGVIPVIAAVAACLVVWLFY